MHLFLFKLKKTLLTFVSMFENSNVVVRLSFKVKNCVVFASSFQFSVHVGWLQREGDALSIFA